MRTQITGDTRRVTVREWDEEGQRVITTSYMAPFDGGYVRICDNRNYPQVCEKLASTGNTLHCGDRESLVEVIRREYRRAKDATRRENARWARG